MSVVFAGKLAAEVVAERAAGVAYSQPLKDIPAACYARSAIVKPKVPIGIQGNGDAISFGGGSAEYDISH